MEVEAIVLRALRGGTSAMRDLGTVLLPADLREQERWMDYWERLNRTHLFDAYNQAIANITARPFQKAVKITGFEELDPDLQKLSTDCDRNGLSLTAFARRLKATLIDRGVCHFMVDMPSISKTKLGRDATHADEMDLDVRPYFYEVHPDNLIDWAYRRDATGRKVLAYIQIYDEATERDARTGKETTKQRIKFWNEQEWQVWERDVSPTQPSQQTTKPNGSPLGGLDLPKLAAQAWNRAQGEPAGSPSAYRMVEQQTHGLGTIPLVTINVNPFGQDKLVARPPLMPLAWLNVEHWQSRSQQANILHFARAPLLKGKGCDPDIVDGTKPVVLGAGAKVFSRNNDFDLNYVEPNGSAIIEGKEDLKGLEDKMKAMALEPLMMVAGGQRQTATGVASDEVRTQAPAQAWIEAEEMGLYQGFTLAAKWKGASLPERPGFNISIFRDIGLLARSAQDLTTLDAGRARGDISMRTYWKGLQERGVLDAEFDPDQEEELIGNERQQQQEAWMDQAKAAAKFKATSAPPTGAKKPPAQNPAMGAA